MRLDEIREREAKATKGPWNIEPCRDGRCSQRIESADVQSMDNGCKVASLFITAWKQGARDARPNADFIAHSREDIPYLLERLTEAERALKGCVDPDHACAPCGRCYHRVEDYFDKWSEK
jgi:hypothetical protein